MTIYRKLNRGFELFEHHRFFWGARKDYRRKPHPYFFFRRYKEDDGVRVMTLQIMRFEYWYR